MFKTLVRSVVVFLLTVPALAWGDKLAAPNYHAEDDVTMRNYEGVNLAGSDFSGSNASGSTFKNARLDYANLSLTNFQNTNLANVTFKLALIEFTDFSGAEGLTAEQLSVACLPRAGQEEKLGVEAFDPKTYQMPEECALWEHMPRSVR